IVYFALNYVSRLNPFRRVDDTLGVIYTHGFAGLAGGLLVGIFADPKMILAFGTGGGASDIFARGLIHGDGGHLLNEQPLAGAWVIAFSAIGTFVLLKLVGVFVPLRMSEKDMETGDLAVHGHEVYPSDVPSLSYPAGIAVTHPAPAPTGSAAPAPSG